MPLDSYDSLNDIQMDALREIGNIGSGNAASAISSMLDRPINITVPTISILDYNEVVENLGGPEQLLVALMLYMSGDVNGMIMFLLHKDFAHMTLNTLMGSDLEDFSEIEEMETSAICIDMAGAVLSVPAIHYANISDKIIFIEDEFSSDQDNAASHVLMVPDVESLNKIMQNLGIEL